MRESEEPRAHRARGLTTADLVSRLGLEPLDDDRRAGGRLHLEVAGADVATVCTEPGAVTTVCATSGRDMPLHDFLAAIAGQRPSGLVVIESTDGDRSRVFLLDQGTVVAGAGHRLDIQAWTAVVVDDPIEQATSTVAELMLDALAVAHEVGARMTWFRGDLEWLGARLDAGLGPALQHLIFEHVRRVDELPRILERLAPLQRRVVARQTPPVEPPKQAPPGSKCLDLDFFAHPDGAALREWADARQIHGLADGRRTIHDIVERAAMGRFRTLAGLELLVRCGYVELVEASDHTVPPIGRVLLKHEGPRSTAARPTPTLAFEGDRGTRYSLTPQGQRIDRVSVPASAAASEALEPEVLESELLDADVLESEDLEPEPLELEARGPKAPGPEARDRGESEETGLDELEDVDVTLSNEVAVDTPRPSEPPPPPERQRWAGLGVLVGLVAAAATVGYMLLPLGS